MNRKAEGGRLVSGCCGFSRKSSAKDNQETGTRRIGMKVILASASPRRRELLAQIGIDFEIKVSNIEEKVTASQPGMVVEELACQKAEAVMRMLHNEEELLVIGADTIVVLDGWILGKPSSLKHAVEMLGCMAGRIHEVYTGVALLYRKGMGGKAVKQKVFHERTKVEFFPMTEKEISAYVSTENCMDKAGAYGIQGLFARYVRRIDGDYNNVVGLPVGRLYQEAKEWLEN